MNALPQLSEKAQVDIHSRINVLKYMLYIHVYKSMSLSLYVGALALVQEVAPRLLYTHHQKTVVVDDPNSNQMVAFVGGLDLTQVLF